MSDPLLDSEQSEFIQAFVEEGREMLDEVEPLLIELEQKADPSSGVDPEVINTIFRLFHSLKGAAGFLDLYTVSAVTHEAETILDIIRKGEASLKSEHIDLFNRAADFIRKLLDSIEQNLNDKGFEDEAGEIIKVLKDTINGLKGELANAADDGETKSQETKSAKAISKPDTSEDKSVEMPEDLASDDSDKKADDSEDDLQFTVSSETLKTFISESEELLETAEQSFLGLEKEPGNKELISNAFRALHSIKGNAGFLGYADIEEISHQAETLLDNLRESGDGKKSDIYTLLLSALDFVRDAISEIRNGNNPDIPGKAGVVGLLEEAIDSLSDSIAEAVPKQKDNGESQDKQNKEEQEIEEREAKPAVIKTDNYTGPERRAETDRRNDAEAKSAGRRANDKHTTAKQTIRVDIDKLDIMMDLVGELVISEAMVSQNPDIKKLNIPLDRFEKSVLQLNKITRDLQDIATSMRMIPLSGTFRKMMRLVRDLSQKVNKKVELEIIGEETEVDKTVIEQINDPLVHIIRNSIDHGLENPDERKMIGKSETGKVVIEAKYVGGEVWIIIQDDGKGLNRERILAKAIDKGLVSGDGSDVKNEDLWPMIFQPGFSTAEEITDVSGRGVGMDVVRKNIEKIRGKVEIASKEGTGTTVTLRIPLTLAIIDGMIIRVGTTQYTIPIVSIKESLRPDEKIISRMMDGQEIVNIRSQLLPVLRLHDFFNIESETTELSEGILVLVENEGKSICLFLDEVIGQQQVVIKGLSNYVGEVSSVSGCTILGDGTISLIIDIKALIDRAESVVQKSEQKLSLTKLPEETQEKIDNKEEIKETVVA